MTFGDTFTLSLFCMPLRESSKDLLQGSLEQRSGTPCGTNLCLVSLSPQPTNKLRICPTVRAWLTSVACCAISRVQIFGRILEGPVTSRRLSPGLIIAGLKRKVRPNTVISDYSIKSNDAAAD